MPYMYSAAASSSAYFLKSLYLQTGKRCTLRGTRERLESGRQAAWHVGVSRGTASAVHTHTHTHTQHCKHCPKTAPHHTTPHHTTHHTPHTTAQHNTTPHHTHHSTTQHNTTHAHLLVEVVAQEVAPEAEQRVHLLTLADACRVVGLRGASGHTGSALSGQQRLRLHMWCMTQACVRCTQRQRQVHTTSTTCPAHRPHPNTTHLSGSGPPGSACSTFCTPSA
jgi:hypothetical protein